MNEAVNKLIKWNLEIKDIFMFSKTERKAHVRCEGERREVGGIVTVGMHVRTIGQKLIWDT